MKKKPTLIYVCIFVYVYMENSSEDYCSRAGHTDWPI